MTSDFSSKRVPFPTRQALQNPWPQISVVLEWAGLTATAPEHESLGNTSVCFWGSLPIFRCKLFSFGEFTYCLHP